MEYKDNFTGNRYESSVIPCYTQNLYAVQTNLVEDGIFWFGKVVAFEAELHLDKDQTPETQLYPIICPDSYEDGVLESTGCNTVFLGSLEGCQAYINREEKKFKEKKIKNGVDKNGK